MSKLRTFLQKERESRGWSQTDLAEKSGIPLSTLSRYESVSNKNKPSHANVLLLARVFDIEPGDVLRYIGYPRRKFVDSTEREQEWSKIRGLIESDPRARKMIEMYDQASEDDKDRGVDLLEVHFKKRPRRPPPKQ